MDPEQVRKEYNEWYRSTYAKTINLKRLETEADNKQLVWLKNAVKNFCYNRSSLWRMEVLHTLKYFIIPKKTEYICVSFKIFRKAETSIIPITSKTEELLYNIIYSVMYVSYDGKDLKYDYVVNGPTFSSADGEYRHRFITYEQVLWVCERFKTTIQEIEEHVYQQLRDKDIYFESNILIPEFFNLTKSNKPINPEEKEKITIQLKKEIDEKKMPIIFYILSWFNDLAKIKRKIIENHLVQGYKETMFSKKDQTFFENLNIVKENGRDFRLMGSNSSRMMKTKTQTNLILEVGQKFIPISVQDVERAGDIKLHPWREIYFTSLVGDLVINGITPAFSIFDDWFLIQGNEYNFWDNKVSHIKLDHSKIAEEIVKQLESARKSTYLVDPIRKKELYLSFSMEGFSQSIEIPMDYAEQNIVLADVILCSLSEHVGRTIADGPNLLRNKEFQMGYGPMYSDYKMFCKYLFDFVYALSNLNVKLGIIHGDLHFNNATMSVKKRYYNIDTGEMDFINPHVIRNFETKNYIFPSSGAEASIIDFSRSFMSSEHLRKNFDEETILKITYSQRNRILRTLEREIPDFYHINQLNIEKILILYPDQVFEIFQAIDIYKLSKNWIYLIQSSILDNKENLKSYGDKKVLETEIIPLLKKVSGMSYKYLTGNLINLISGTINKLENINSLIIRECFKEFEIENYPIPLKDGEPFISLMDYFSSNNELIYNIREYDKFPENIKFDYILTHHLESDDEAYLNYERYEDYLEKKSNQERVDEIKEEEIKTKPERRGTPEILYQKIPASPKQIEQFMETSGNISEFYFET